MRRRLPLILLLCASAASAASNAPPGYAQAPDYLEKDTQPKRYVPLHLLDGRDTTAWCAPGGSPARVVIGFKDVVSVDGVQVYTGDGTDRSAFKARARAKRLTLTVVDASRSLKVEDKRGLQAVPLNPPLLGARFILEVADRFPGASPEAPVCVTDLIFMSGGKPLNGPAQAPLMQYSAKLAPLLGTWFGGLEGAPDRFLSFYVDGTFRFTREPLEGGGPSSVTGTYTVSGNQLTLQGPKRGRATLSPGGGEPGSGHTPGATLELDAPLAEDWGREFRGQP